MPLVSKNDLCHECQVRKIPRAPHYCPKPGCRNLIPAGVKYCEDHKPVPWSGGMNAWQGHGTTRAQRALVAQVLREEPVCADCGYKPSTEAGHIIGKAQGGTFTRANLKGQCRDCNLKQMRADRGLATQGGSAADTPLSTHTGGSVTQAVPVYTQGDAATSRHYTDDLPGTTHIGY